MSGENVSPEHESGNDPELIIASAKSLPELFNLIGQHGIELRTSSGELRDARNLQDEIRMVIAGEKNLKFVTRIAGLRDKLRELSVSYRNDLELYEREINQAETVDELIDLISAHNITLIDNSGVRTPEVLQDLVKTLRIASGDDIAKKVPKMAGLREKAIELINAEKGK